MLGPGDSGGGGEGGAAWGVNLNSKTISINAINEFELLHGWF